MREVERGREREPDEREEKRKTEDSREAKKEGERIGVGAIKRGWRPLGVNHMWASRGCFGRRGKWGSLMNKTSHE